eukprot:TRINITY_DN2816_c0_g1_i1.p1 TRINITY_DN2816_c0_g1~~TRINITY_DN2816_c0_g1_i1.p1  ORF type:complete len:330 (-),score=51.68 TRINITY_DN2816_c0_g1_i1:261-1250(-)
MDHTMNDSNLTPMFSSSRRKSATRDQIASYFHLPIAAASREIGICATLLKKICRKYGIPRWPFRKLKSIEKAMVNLIDSLRSSPQEEGVFTQLLRLQRQKENILFGFAKTQPNALPAGSSPDDLIKFFRLESVATSAESFSDEDEEDSGSNDRKAQNKPQNEFMKESDIISFAVSAVQKKSASNQDPTAMKYFEPQRQANYGSNLRNTVPPYGIAPHMVVAYPRSISPTPNPTTVPSWSNPISRPDVPPTLPAAVSPTISPLKAVASSNLFNFKLAPNDYSCRRSIDFSESQATSASYSQSGDSSPPLPSWFKQEQLAARQIQAKLNLA